MRWTVLLAALLVAGMATAADRKGVTADTASGVADTMKSPKGVTGKRAPKTGVTGVVSGGVMELSDSDCTNLQCELRIMTSCATRVGCKCAGTGVTICVDTIDPD